MRNTWRIICIIEVTKFKRLPDMRGVRCHDLTRPYRLHNFEAEPAVTLDQDDH